MLAYTFAHCSSDIFLNDVTTLYIVVSCFYPISREGQLLNFVKEETAPFAWELPQVSL